MSQLDASPFGKAESPLMRTILTQQVPFGHCSVWWIGQSGFFIKLSNGKILLLDAYLSESVRGRNTNFSRQYPPPMHPHQVRCDYYLCTHNHLDHTDPDTLKGLVNLEETLFIGPRNSLKTFLQCGIPSERTCLLEAGDGATFPGFDLTGAFAIPNEENVLDSLGWVISTQDGPTLYHTGDTAYHPFLDYVRKYEIDLMMPCINGKYGNMNGQQAFQLVQAISPKWVIPTQYDLFALNSADPYAFQELFPIDSKTKCLVAKIGQPLTFSNLDRINS